MSLINSNLLFLAPGRYPIKSKLRCFIKHCTVLWGWAAWTGLLCTAHADLCIPDSFLSCLRHFSPCLLPPPWSEDPRCPWQLIQFPQRGGITAMAWDLGLYEITRTNLGCPQLACFADPTQTLGPLSIAWCLNVQSGSENSYGHNWADAYLWINLSFHTGHCGPRQTLGHSWLVKVWIQAMKSMLDLEPSASHPEWTKRWGHHGAWGQAPALASVTLNEPGPASLSTYIPCHSLLVTPLASFPPETPSHPLTRSSLLAFLPVFCLAGSVSCFKSLLL